MEDQPDYDMGDGVLSLTVLLALPVCPWLMILMLSLLILILEPVAEVGTGVLLSR